MERIEKNLEAEKEALLLALNRPEEAIIKKTYSEHYQGDIQPIEVMQANMTREELIGYLKGNIIKYVCRFGRKDAPEKESAKIARYAEWLSVVAKGGIINPRK